MKFCTCCKSIGINIDSPLEQVWSLFLIFWWQWHFTKKIAKIIIISQRYLVLFFQFEVEFSYNFLTIIFDYSSVARQQRCAARINSYASADICKITIRSQRYNFAEYLHKFRLWIAVMQSHEQAKLRRYLHLTKECRDIATAIHPYYEKMYPVVFTKWVL